MITNSKKEQLINKITATIYNSGNIYPPSAIDDPVYREMCDQISYNIKTTVQNAMRELIDDLYTQEQFEDDIGLKQLYNRLMNKPTKLIEIAKTYIGTKEEGGDNKGPQVEEFQKAIGKAEAESWCVSFIQYCVKKVDAELGGDENKLSQTELVLKLWNDGKDLRIDSPEAGCIMLWEHYKDGKKTGLGHAGIVTSVSKDGKTVMTVEGNTSDGSGIDRNGDGCYARQRNVASSATSTMKVLGFMKIWVESEKKDLLPDGPTEHDINVKLKEIEDQMQMFTCTKCKISKELESFSKNKSNKNGRSTWCKACIKNWKLENPDKALDSLLKCDYGLSLKEYNSLLTNQKDSCAICKRHKSNFTKRLFVDHCHKTGRIRGLLCSSCNGVLGRFNDDPSLFEAASNYLKEGSMSQISAKPP